MDDKFKTYVDERSRVVIELRASVLDHRNMLGLVAVEELVEGKPMVPNTKLTPNYFSSNKYSPHIRSNLADG